MAWTSVGVRSVPLIICGPILRRVEPTAVNVWVALSQRDTVTLTILKDGSAVATSPPTAAINLGFPEMDTTAPGHLFVALLTATPVTPLVSDETYTYDLIFSSGSSFQAALGVDDLSEISYLPSPLDAGPSFSLPPQQLSQVNIAHASCRKARGQSVDALPVLDAVMTKASTAASALPTTRIHQLVLTGDQFYADDVAPQFLAMCIDAAGWLMGGKKEKHPPNIGPLAQQYPEDGSGTSTSWRASDWHKSGFATDYTTVFPWDIQDPWPGVGERGPHMFGAGFTVTPPDREIKDPISSRIPMVLPPPSAEQGSSLSDAEYSARFSAAANHLMLLGEFYACYLLSWSPALWAPAVDDLPLPDLTTADWNKGNVAAVTSFRQGLGAVRRVLANIPTFMILDDHDVTDDWFMNREWCNRVLSETGDTLGRRVMRNALIAYAIFQAWGNTPEQFADSSQSGGTKTAGASLLAKLSAGDEMGRDLDPSPDTPSAADLVGIPTPTLAVPAGGATTSALNRSSGALTWSYRWGLAGWPYELIALDCRTVRGYLRDPLAPPLLLDDGDGGSRPDQTRLQIPVPDQPAGTPLVTLAIIQTPLFGMVAVDNIASLGKSAHWVFENDAEAWSMSPRAQQAVLARLVEHNPMTVVLSGDVHYSFGFYVDYWATQPWRASQPLGAPRTGRLVQLVSSSARNQELKTQTAPWLAPAMGKIGSTTVFGWNAAPAAPRIHDLGTLIRAIKVAVTPPLSLGGPPYVIPEDLVPAWTTPADWAYRIRPVVASDVTGSSVSPVDSMPTDPALLATVAGAVQRAISDVADTLSAVVVGNNNVCLVTFTGTGPSDWAVQQTMYTRPADSSGQSTTPEETILIGAPLQFVPKSQW